MFLVYDYSFVIGRFQLPHKPHVELILEAKRIAKRVVIGLGSSNLRRSLRNPFTASERQMLIEHSNQEIKDAVRNGSILFVHLEDSVYSDQWWVEHVQRKFKQAVEKSKVLDSIARREVSDKPKIALVGHNKDDTSYYLSMFPQWDFHAFESKQVLSATECREAYFQYGLEDKSVQNRLVEFTTSGVREALRYIPTQTYQTLKNRFEFVQKYKKEWGEGPHYTADAVVIKSGHVLLIQRGQEPDIGSWAFPGGFADLNKETAYQAAIRECQEETGLNLYDTGRYESVALNYYAKPFRDDRGDIRTCAYLFDLGTGPLPEVKGQDDAQHAEWVPVADLRADNMFADHYFIFRDLTRRI
jgi:bifunctional NMN adenylyltransferase/nudix hydrolase